MSYEPREFLRHILAEAEFLVSERSFMSRPNNRPLPRRPSYPGEILREKVRIS